MEYTIRIKLLVVSSFAVLLSACRAGFEADNLSSGDPDNNDVTLSQLQQDIFSPRCSGCHGGANPQAGLRLDNVSNSFNNLVNRRSSQSDINLVTPNNVSNSYLVQKVEGSATSGERMPLNNSPLSTAQIDDIKSWINNGAQQLSSSGEPTQIYSKSDVIADGRYQVEVVFGRDIDGDLVQSAAIEMHITYPDFTLTVLPTDTAVQGSRLIATLILDADMPAPLAITTVFNHETAAPILDVQGRAVDGNGDRTEGGKFIFQSSAIVGAQDSLQ